MTDARRYAIRFVITVALGAVVGLVGFFVSDPGHAGPGAGTVTLNLDCVRDHLAKPDQRSEILMLTGKLEMLNQCAVAIIPGGAVTKSFLPQVAPQRFSGHPNPISGAMAGSIDIPNAEREKDMAEMTPTASQRFSGHRTPVSVAMTESTDIPLAEKEKDMFEIRSRVLGSEREYGLGPNDYAVELRHKVESNPMFQHAVELTRRVLEPERPGSLNAFKNVPASMEKSVVALTRQIFSPELKQTINALKKYAAKLGGVGLGAATELSKMDAGDIKRHLFVGIAAVAASQPPSVALAADNVANIATRADLGTMGAYLAVILGLSIPVVFLITVYIQSEAQGTATTFRQPDSIGGTRFEDE
jgi:hypothetical protein